MLQCIMDKCDEQDDKCVAEERITEARSKMEKKIARLGQQRGPQRVA